MSRYPSPFGKHLLLERINVGGMAEVFKAKSFGVAGFERIVAVKRILPTLQEDEEFITMFIDEARIAAHLTHQNIVQIYELGSHENNFFISMEYVAGRDLRQILDNQKKLKRPMSTAKAAFVVSQVCEALEYAHRKKDPAGKDLKIIHRDVTPQNVIISYEGEVKLCDFGIAKAASRASRTQVGVLKGKFAYMSPEQVKGQPTDRRSDLFALGVIFYEMLTGERLFLGESDYSTLEAVRNAKVPAPRKLNPNLSRGLEKVVLKMLTRDPKDRYQWASEVHEDLQDHLIDDKRLYHARHLRRWMQDTYARDIEIENAKLEEFMRMRMEEELPEVEADEELSGPLVEQSRSAAPPDPANYSRTYAPSEGMEAGDETDNIELPVASRPHQESLPTRPIDYNESETEEGRDLSEGPVPMVGTPSPVSSLYGTPEVSEKESSGPGDDAVVIVPKSAHPEDDEIDFGDETVGSEEAERTLFDMKPMPELGRDENETLFDDDRETVGHDELNDELSAAQAALIEKLDDIGGLGEENDTIDASSHDSEEVPVAIPPSVSDPSDDPLANATFDESDLDDETSVSPVAGGMLEDEDAYGPTMVRPQSDVPLGLEDHDTNEEFGTFSGDEGTMEESPTGMVGRLEPTSDTSSRPRISPVGLEDSGEVSQRSSAPTSGPRRRRIREVNEGSGPSVVPAPVSTTPRREVAPSARTFDNGAIAVDQRARAGRDPIVLMLIAAAVGLLSVSVLAFTLLSGGGDDTVASLQILTEPTRDVVVKIDGSVVGESTPVDIGNLELGVHEVELSAPGYRTYTQRIQITQAKPHTMVVPLERAPTLDPHVVKNQPEEKAPPEVAPPPPEEAAPPPPPPAPPPEKAPPPPVKKQEARVIQKTPPRRAPKKTKKPSGFLMVSTTPPGVNVLIDGKSTGLVTPIRKPYPLAPGRHRVTFVMGNGKKYDFGVNIESGETRKLLKTLR